MTKPQPLMPERFGPLTTEVLMERLGEFSGAFQANATREGIPPRLIESITLVHDGWERDSSVVYPA
jgi:hypothetical protein